MRLALEPHSTPVRAVDVLQSPSPTSTNIGCSSSFRSSRQLLVNLALKLSGTQGEISNERDAHFFSNKMNIASGLFIMSGNMDLEKFQDEIQLKFVLAKDAKGQKLFPKSTRYMSYKLGVPVWIEETSFDIKEHVYLLETTEPRMKQNMTNMTSLIRTPFPDDKAPWQFILIRGGRFEGFSEQKDAVLFKSHHAVGDGLAIHGFFHKLFGVDESITKFAKENINYINKIWLTIKAVVALMQTLFKPTSVDTPKLSGERLVAWSDEIDVNIIKKMKAQAGATFNDVLTACLAGSVRKYLQRPAQAHVYTSQAPSSIRCFIPANMRKPGCNLALDNKVNYFPLEIPINIKNPVETLLECKKRMDALKNCSDHIVRDWYLRLAMNLVPCLMHLWFKKHKQQFPMIFSSLPPVHNKLHFAGQPVKSIRFPPVVGLHGQYTCAI